MRGCLLNRLWGRALLCSMALGLLGLNACDSGGEEGATPGVDALVDADPVDSGVDAIVDAEVDVDVGSACGVCPRELVCDEAEATCVEVAACERDAQCLEGRICEEGGCVAGCEDDGACEAIDRGRALCIEGRCGNCATDDDCFGELTCDAYLCEVPETCESSRACPVGQVCDEATSGCVPVFDCREVGVECLGGMTCLASGECALTEGSCVDSTGCGFGDVCRDDLRPARCGECQSDDQCPAGQLCESGVDGARCVEPFACVHDHDCIGARICEQGECTVPSCDDDDAEENDDLASATVLAGDLHYGGLMSCDVDWFRLEVPAGVLATVSLRQEDQDADLELAVFDENEAMYGQSATEQPVEAVVLSPFGSSRPVFVRVAQSGADSAASYSLDVVFSDGASCVDDALEAGAGDDTIATGHHVRGLGDEGFDGEISGRVCPGDADMICFWLNRQETFTARVNVVAGSPTLTGRLVNEVGEPVLVSDVPLEGTWNRAGGEDLVWARTGQGVFCLEFMAEDAPGSYVVGLAAVSPGVKLLCDASELLQFDNDGVAYAEGRLVRDSSQISTSCAGGQADGGEQMYTITPEEPGLLVARVTGLVSGDLGNPVLSVRRTCTDSSSQLGCATGFIDPLQPYDVQVNPAELRVVLPEAGRDDDGETISYTLVVDGVDVGRTSDFALEAILGPMPRAQQQETCGVARPLQLNDDGVVEVQIDLGSADDDGAACLGAGGPDAYYTLELTHTSRVTVQTTGANDTFAVGAYLLTGCGGEVMACGYGFDEELPAGEYVLVIDGAGPNSRGLATAQVVVEAYDAPADNDTCGDAAPLVGVTGSIEGDTRGASDDYRLLDDNRCTRFNSQASDVVFALPVVAGEQYFVEATPELGWDLSLYVVEDCGDLLRSCVAGSDGALTEAVVFEAAVTRNIFVVVDGTNDESGAFGLRWGPAECGRDAECPVRCVDYLCVD